MGVERYLRFRKIVFILCVYFFAAGAARAGEIEVYFSPRGNCSREIMQELSGAKETIDIAMYYFTSVELADMLVEMKDRGVKIRIYLDESQEMGKYSKAQFLKNRGVQVKFESGSGLMHNKFCVIDNKTVITGSYNWTKNAEERNDENVIILHDSETAKIYQEQFNKYWGWNFVCNSAENQNTRARRELRGEGNMETTSSMDNILALRESFFADTRPPLLNFNIDIGEEFMDSEDDELETGDYKYLSTALKLDQKINFRCDYTVGIKQHWKNYSEKDRDNQSNALFFDVNYQLSKPWIVSFGIEEEIKNYNDANFDYNALGAWTRFKFRQVPWEAWVKTGFKDRDYKDADEDKQDVFLELGTSRYLFCKDNRFDLKYKVSLRDYQEAEKGNNLKQAVHLGLSQQF